MSVISAQQAAQYAIQAGFSGKSVQTIVAIAQAESGLNTQAQNLQDPNGGSWGILQINGAHFGAGWSGGVMTKAAALDPMISFQYAFFLSHGGTNFTPWGAYTNGSYAQFMTSIAGTNTTPTGAPTTGSTGAVQQQPQSTGLNPLSLLIPQGTLDWISNPVRLMKFSTGVVLLGIGVFLMLEPGAQQTIVQAAKVAAMG